MNYKSRLACRASVLAASMLYASLVYAQDSGADEDEVFNLSPFEVTVSSNTGYQETDTLAGTRIRTDLRDVGSAVSVVNEQFLDDTGATDNASLLTYVTNTEVGGISGNFVGAGNGAVVDTADQRLNPNNNTRVRGLTAADNTRNFFLTNIPWDSYNTSRIDLQRGPNAVLFGVGSPAGIINANVDAATIGADSTDIDARYGSYGSYRGSLNHNQTILDDELAVRVALLHDQQYYRQDPAYEKDSRQFVAFRYDPKWLRFDGARTTIKFSYENGEIDANRPRTTPPLDAITPWFTDLNQITADPSHLGVTDPEIVAAHPNSDYGMRQASLDDGSPSPNYSPWIGAAGRLYDNPAAVFPYANSSQMNGAFDGRGGWDYFAPNANTYGALGVDSSGNLVQDDAIDSMPWSPYSGIVTYDTYAVNAALPYSDMGAYKAKSLTDTSIFDFKNKLLEGPNKHEWQDFDVHTVQLTQTFMDNLFGFDVAWDSQNYTQGRQDMLSGFAQALTVDINAFYPDGTPNPNVGRPMVVSDSISNVEQIIERDTIRVQAFADVDLKNYLDPESTLTKILGRHTFTALYNRSQNDEDNYTWWRYIADDSYGVFANAEQRNSGERAIATVSYLGDSLVGADSASGAHISNITARQVPSSGSLNAFIPDYDFINGANPTSYMVDDSGDVTDMYETENPANYVGWTNNYNLGIISDTTDRDGVTTNHNTKRQVIDSKAFVWQGYLFGGNVVPLLGYREDTVESYNMGYTGEAGNYQQTGWNKLAEFEDDSLTKSLMVHSPEFVNKYLPFNSTISVFWNESENFNPAGVRQDVVGRDLPPPTGETQDYGFLLSSFDNRVSFKVTWYETDVSNATIEGFNGMYMLGAAEAWGYMFAKQAQEGVGSFAGDNQDYIPGPDQTEAEAIAEQESAIAAFMDNLPDQAFYDYWDINLDDYATWINYTQQSTLAVTGDTHSEGVEFELFLQPTDNWNITVNAAKTTASRTNLAGSLVDWVEERYDVYNNTDAGLVRMWGPWYNPGETVRGKFNREFMSQYNLYRQLEGSDVAELRPWRFNIVTNYNFSGDSFLKGVNIGGAYRWQDKIVLGYPIIDEDGDPSTSEDNYYDIDNPWKGDAEYHIDLWVGYSRTIFDDVEWRLQLNVRNAFGEDDLIPINVQYDGSPAQYRIPESTTWTLSSSFKF
ncbi:MAG: TonB-dependent receptor plug [Puniceicoccaceae bacterium 5H]|nr:MAG: TonB-dependent receptor plug [Puniceicoccaceae bacterium 5H]